MHDQQLILVDEDDEQVGVAGRLECHDGVGLLHRAFTVLVFDGSGNVLLQRRSGEKLLWPGYWETSCSGHPSPGEDLVEAARRRMEAELGFSIELEDLGRFEYNTPYGDSGTEHEVCHTLAGRYAGAVTPDPAEVSEVRWVGVEALKEEIASETDVFAPWLSPALEVLGV